MTLTSVIKRDHDCKLRLYQIIFQHFHIAFDVYFFKNTRSNFNRDYVTKHMQEKIGTLSYKENYTSHSFQRRSITPPRLIQLLQYKILLVER